jgi:Concanavalin A-like lectin/glucanases superfamily/Bacterial Ig-like domain/Bacterial Ig domain
MSARGKPWGLCTAQGKGNVRKSLRLVPAIGIAVVALAAAAPALAAPPPPGLVAAYAFDEGSGTTAVDATGSGNNGAVVGATWAPGRYGGALSFDGTDDYVGLPGLGTFYNTAFTLEAWVQKATTKNDVGIVGSWTGNGPMLWVDHLASRHHLTLGGGLATYLDSGRNPVVGQWQHLAATFDGASARYYVDGVEVASRSFSGSVGSSNTWRIGAYGFAPGGFFDGVIDEIRVYDRALSAAEIVADRDAPIAFAPATEPTTPGNLAVTGSTQTSISLAWTASTDDVAVTGYDVYSAGALAGSPVSTSFTVTGLACSSGYVLEVAAKDGDGNVSPRARIVGSTSPCATVSGMQAAYAFDDGTGVLAADSSGHGRTGSVSGATWTTGRHAGALSFDGIDDQVALPPLGTFYSTAFSLEAWVLKSGAKKDAAIVGSWAGDGPMLWVDHAAGRHYLTLGASFSGYLDSGVSPTSGQWQHIAATFDGTTARYYVDGAPVASRASGSPGSSNVWRIGAYGASPGGFFDGAIDDVRVWSRALTAAEVLYNREHGVDPSAVPPDVVPPSAPGTLAGTPGTARVTLTWGAASDNTGVTRYNVHRSTTPGFTPTAANRIAQPTATTYANTGLNPGTYYFLVTAEDASGNVGPPSNEAAATVADTTAPSIPGTLTATGGVTQASLSWGPATDNVGVVRYNVYRSTVSGFTPSTSNRVGQPTGTTFTNTGVAPGTHYYKVRAEDAGGNLGPSSNQASAVISADTVPPTVSLTSPSPGSTVGGLVALAATAADNIGVLGVQFRIDGVNLGAEDVAPPFEASWNTHLVSNGAHTLTAVARDGGGNTATATANVTVSNTSVSPTGLRASYALNETSGSTVADWSGNGNNGTTSGSTWIAGQFGNAASFDGSNDRINLPATLGTFYNGGFTLEAWVRKSTTKKDVMVLGSWVAAQGGGPMIWVDHADGRYYLTLGTGGFATYLDSGRAPAIGQWQHIAATYDGATARFYIDGAQVASRTFAGTVGNSNTWRMGAYEATPTGFFDGRIDNVRVYSRALSAAEVQANMWTPVSPETVPPVVTSVSPAAGAAGANAGAIVTATFNEAMSPASVSASSFRLETTAGTPVSATVAYDATTRTARLTPQSALTYGGTYTARVVGGAAGVKDAQGNALAADHEWSFSVEASPPQLLVVTSTTRPFSSYLGEILNAEGLNLFTTIDVAFLSPALLSGFDTVVLGETPITPAQASTLSGWVSSGGNLITMRPDAQLAGLLGLATAGGTRSNAYVRVNTASGPGVGIVGETMQYHGAADNYTLAGATTVATLWASATTATSNPAVTLRSVGTSGGQAAAFTYDLARSVVYTRQGNPSWAGQERDGVSGIRPDDMFYSSWINTSKIQIPQADEQQRLLANLITQMNADVMPLPRFWYLPRGEKAVVVMSGDDHSPGYSPGGTAFAFDRFKALSPSGCNVAAWECVRGTSYVLPGSVLTNAQAAGYVAEGFEVGLHPIIASCPTTPITEAQLSSIFDAQLSSWAASFPSVPSPVSNRNHCVYWPDWASAAKVELAHGMRLDANYYHYPAPWIGARPGFMNGGGFPMRFADSTGVPIDVFQQNTNMTDESTTNYQLHIDTLLDNALGANGYYGAFGMNMHTDNPSLHPGSETVVAEAQARGVPVISYKQLLDWVDGRDDSTIRGLAWNAGTLTFTTTVGAGAAGMQILLPTQGQTGTLSAISTGGQPVAFTVQTIKGIQYAVFGVSTGAYVATYS